MGSAFGEESDLDLTNELGLGIAKAVPVGGSTPGITQGLELGLGIEDSGLELRLGIEDSDIGEILGAFVSVTEV
jgi:hypothetical protein